MVRKRRHFSRAHSCVLLLGLLATAGGCDGTGAVGPPRGVTVSFGGSSSSALQLVGSWRRTLFYFDDFGFAYSSETTWQFSSDGSAIRSIVTRNLTLGYADAAVAVARWQVTASRVTIDFVSPDPGRIELDFRVVGNELTLAGQTFSRIGG